MNLSTVDKVIHILTLGLATWRLSSLLVNEQGPMGIFEKLRRLVGIEYDKANRRIGQNWLASEMTCQWCFGVYVGLLFGLLYLLAPLVAFYVALPFALSTISILIMTNKGIQIYLRHLNDDS